jgi:hypothetical protein
MVRTQAYKISPPSLKIGPPSSKIGPPSSEIGPPNSEIGPPSSKIGPPSSKIGPPENKRKIRESNSRDDVTRSTGRMIICAEPYAYVPEEGENFRATFNKQKFSYS